MKYIFAYTIFILCLSCSVTTKAQNSNNPFYGIWQYQNGNQTFQVELFFSEDVGNIRGHFKMFETSSNGITTLIYKSNKDLDFGLNWGPVIFADSDGNSLAGHVEDNSISLESRLSGNLEMKILTNTGPEVIKATWKVKRGKGIRLTNDTRTFNIPIDIVLTKVN